MTTCPACGSTKIIPSVPLRADVGGMDVGGTRTVDVELYSKHATHGMATGGLFARVCGDCGRTELYVRDFRFLYEHYEASRTA